MSKKPIASTAFAPHDQRDTVAQHDMQSVAEPATPDNLLRLLGSQIAIAKLIGSGGEVKREQGIVLVTGRSYATRECVVPAEEIYYDITARRVGGDHYLGEADKVSWLDDASGYDCVMLRDAARGFLSGYVCVPPGHPLWGWSYSAVPIDIGPEVHGGLNYARISADYANTIRDIARNARGIANVSRRQAHFGQNRQAVDHRVEGRHGWWFGFSCDKACDLVPGDAAAPLGFVPAKFGRTYRSDGYVAREIIALAAQLRAIDDCEASC